MIAHILIIDDDERLRDLLQRYLLKNNYFVSTASHIDMALEQMSFYQYDLIILDVMLEGTDSSDKSGLQFARDLRENNNYIPILMLTALGSTEDRIEGLKTGIDDYLVKPFEPQELILRMGSILKRSSQKSYEKEIIKKKYIFGDFSFDEVTQKLMSSLEFIPLSVTEQKVLYYFCQHAGSCVDRQTLKEISNMENQSDRAIDVVIARLRKKIERNTKKPVFLQTVHGQGYVFKVEEIRSYV